MIDLIQWEHVWREGDRSCDRSCDQLTSEHSQKPWDGIKLSIRNSFKSLNFKTYVREKPNAVESVKNHRIMVRYELRENCQILYTKKSHMRIT